MNMVIKKFRCDNCKKWFLLIDETFWKGKSVCEPCYLKFKNVGSRRYHVPKTNHRRKDFC